MVLAARPTPGTAHASAAQRRSAVRENERVLKMVFPDTGLRGQPRGLDRPARTTLTLPAVWLVDPERKSSHEIARAIRLGTMPVRA